MNQPTQPAPADSTQATPTGLAPLLDQATQWLGQLPQSLKQLPQSLKLQETGTKAVASFNRLSTTQKVVGGVLLVLGVRALTRGGKKGKHAKQAKTLNELLYFVNDRIEGYKRAVRETQDSQLRDYYQHLVRQSQRFAGILNDHLRHDGGRPQTSTTLKGKLYRRFMAAASAFTGHDEKAILASNIHGEQWALKAYEEALDDDTLHGPLRHEVERQYAQSQKTYRELKKLTAQQ